MTVPVLAASTSAFDQPGTLGFLVVFGMAIVLYFLFRSMARHLRKVNTAARAESAGVQGASATSSGSGGTGVGGAGGAGGSSAGDGASAPPAP